MKRLLGNTRSIGLLCVALVFGGFAVLAIRGGRVSATLVDRGAHVTMQESPTAFWGIVMVAVLVAVICAVFALRSPTTHPQANIGQTKLPSRLAIPFVAWLIAVGVFILILGFTGNIPP